MANQEHVDRLLQGVELWNRWREEDFWINPDLFNADLRNANLSGADLHNADLRYADLRNANLSGADLRDANLRNVNLRQANLFGSNLPETNLERANLERANLERANLVNAYLVDARLNGSNLKNAKLQSTLLSGCDLTYADCAHADFTSAKLDHATLIRTRFIGASLRNSDLTRVSAWEAIFKEADLTGACIQDWGIAASTRLENVVCEYIFLKAEQQDRRPHDPNQIFAPGEFTKRYQIVLETVDLFFNNGIDWKAFLASLQDLKTEYGEDLNLQGIEKKAGGSFVVRLEVPSDADKGAIERTTKERYETHLRILEAKYHAELQLKDKEIEGYRRENVNMMRTIELLASQPIINKAMASADNKSHNQSKNPTYNQQGSKWGGGFAADGGIQIGGQFIDASSQQNLAEAAQDIQQLLDQLSATYPTTTNTDRMMVAAKAVEEIEKNPALQQRIIGALKAGGVEALKELVDHPAVNILLATIEGWQNPT